MPIIAKFAKVCRLAVSNPAEFTERLRGRVERRLEKGKPGNQVGGVVQLQRAVALLDEALSVSISGALAEPSLKTIERATMARLNELQQTSPMPPAMNADITLARFCYAVCRATKPSVALETGVASGVTSAFILAALKANGGPGTLWSVDLPPLAAEPGPHVGAVVPDHLRRSWNLRLGPSRTVLPGLLNELGTVDIFLHDSLHTRRNMLAEFEMIWPRLRTGGLLVADDVNMNSAFAEFCERQHRHVSFAVQEREKSACFGIIVKCH